MGTVVVFWATTMAILFFLLGLVVKGLAAAFDALFASLFNAIYIGLVAGFTVFSLLFLYWLVKSIVTYGFWGMMKDVVGVIIMVVIMVAAVTLLTAGIPVLVLQIVLEFLGLVAVVLIYLLEIVLVSLEYAAVICDKIYSYFLRVVVKQIEQ